ncbi:response regulator transcription factor [Cerasicoccus frondis]|uniref:response regulator transcription factor n=1 Tax=Cerasicoccus frondis TaxID=490090 RepID=UPI0028529913|nr:LuxR C-terminal-related transcriptional regulator [Cerasicoccus frondis]
MPLSHAQVEKFCFASERLMRPDLGLDNYAERSFEFIDTLLSSEFVIFGTLDPRTQVLEISVNKEITGWTRAITAYGHLMADYKLWDWDHTVNDGKPFTRSDFFSNRQFRDTSMFSEVYGPLGIDDHCAVHVPGVSGEIPFFGVERQGGTDYTTDERDLLRLAQSLLGNARSIAKARDNLSIASAKAAALCRAGLTPREADVLYLVSEGKSNEEIAIILGIEVYTVKDHVKSVYRKTGCSNRLSAALWALQTTRLDETRALKRHLSVAAVNVTAWAGQS